MIHYLIWYNQRANIHQLQYKYTINYTVVLIVSLLDRTIISYTSAILSYYQSSLLTLLETHCRVPTRASK